MCVRRCLVLTLCLAAACGDGGADPGDGDLAAPSASDLGAVGDGAVGPIVDLSQADLSFLERCFGVLPLAPKADYAQWNPSFPMTHCSGTNAQDILGVERVVFLGDSITVGTPPTAAGDLFRAKLAAQLATKFGLAAPSGLWDAVDLIKKVSLQKTSGAFSSCAKWGARIEDLQGGDDQIGQCFEDVEPRRTLVVMTMGGNDFQDIAKAGGAGATTADLIADEDARIAKLSAALDRLTSAAHFPNGSFVIFTNNYEFTDATGDVPSCLAAITVGLSKSPPDAAMLFLHFNEQMLGAAVAHHADLVFMAESFCGHGFHHADPASPCYRGPGNALWFDPNTCTHPNTAGHAALAQQFMDVVNE